MGLMQIYWFAMGKSGIHGTLWMNIFTGVPAAIIGAWVGVLITEWVTKQIIIGNPNLAAAALRGLLYGLLAGVVIGAACMVPLLTIGHYMGTIQFFAEGSYVFVKILGTGAMGGGIFGGMIGAAAGVVYGPGITWYIQH